MQIKLKETRLFVHAQLPYLSYSMWQICSKFNGFAIFVRNGRWGRTTSATYDYVTDLISNKQKVSGAQMELKWASEWQVYVYTLRLCNRLQVGGGACKYIVSGRAIDDRDSGSQIGC